MAQPRENPGISANAPSRRSTRQTVTPMAAPATKGRADAQHAPVTAIGRAQLKLKERKAQEDNSSDEEDEAAHEAKKGRLYNTHANSILFDVYAKGFPTGAQRVAFALKKCKQATEKCAGKTWKMTDGIGLPDSEREVRAFFKKMGVETLEKLEKWGRKYAERSRASATDIEAVEAEVRGEASGSGTVARRNEKENRRVKVETEVDRKRTRSSAVDTGRTPRRRPPFATTTPDNLRISDETSAGKHRPDKDTDAIVLAAVDRLKGNPNVSIVARPNQHDAITIRLVGERRSRKLVYPCPAADCSTVDTLCLMVRHISRDHFKTKSYCEYPGAEEGSICGRSFTRMDPAVRHLRVHKDQNKAHIWVDERYTITDENGKRQPVGR